MTKWINEKVLLEAIRLTEKVGGGNLSFFKRIIKDVPKERDIYPLFISFPEWIPCSKRLPKETEEYLITTKDQYGDTFVKKTMYFPDEKLWWGVYSSETVTAWMPVPKPYEGTE